MSIWKKKSDHKIVKKKTTLEHKIMKKHKKIRKKYKLW